MIEIALCKSLDNTNAVNTTNNGDNLDHDNITPFKNDNFNIHLISKEVNSKKYR